MKKSLLRITYILSTLLLSLNVSLFAQCDWEINGLEGAGWDWPAAATISSLKSATHPISGNLHIAFVDNANQGKLTVKRYSHLGWEPLGLEGFSENPISEVALTIGANGIPYVFYREAGSNLSIVQRYNGLEWKTVGEVGFTDSTASWLSIAVDINNHPTVLYRDNGKEKKATVQQFNGSNWETLGSAGFSNSEIQRGKIVFDNNNTPYVAYAVGDFDPALTVRKYNGNTWEPVGEVNFSQGHAQHFDIALSPDNTPYIIVQDVYHTGAGLYNYDAKVQMFNGTGWETIGDFGNSNRGFKMKIAFDSKGTPYTAFLNGNGLGGMLSVKKYVNNQWEFVGKQYTTEERYLESVELNINQKDELFVTLTKSVIDVRTPAVHKFNGTTWKTLGEIGLSQTLTNHSSIALDKDNTAYLACVVSGGEASLYGPIQVHKQSNESWTQITSGDLAGGNVKLSSSPDGSVYLTYYANEGLQVKKYLGGSWQNLSDSRIKGAHSVMVFDKNSTPWLINSTLGQDMSQSTLYRLNGTNWEQMGDLSMLSGLDVFRSAVFDNNNTFYFSHQNYSDDRKVFVHSFDGANWEQVGESISSGAAIPSNLAIDDNGALHLAYIDLDNDNTVILSRYNGSSWETITSIGTASDDNFPKTFNNEERPFLSLTMHNNTPFLAYVDAESRRVTVKRYSNNTPEVVGSAGFSELNSCALDLQIDNQGKAYLGVIMGGANVYSMDCATSIENTKRNTSQSINISFGENQLLVESVMSPIQKLQLFDLSGKVVSEEHISDKRFGSLQLPTLPQGIYVLSVQTHEGNQVIKLGLGL